MWERAVSQPPAALTATADIVLAASGHTVQALSAAAGTQLWSHAAPTYPIVITAADGAVYVAGSSNPTAHAGPDEVYAFQA